MNPISLIFNPLLKPREPAFAAKPVDFKTAHVLRRKTARREFNHSLEVANAAKELGRLPDADESIHVVMRGNFHGWDIVPAVLRLGAPSVIEELCVATLGFNKQNAAELLAMLDDGRVKRVSFVCSCYFKASCPEEFEMLASGLTDRGHPIVAARSHAKILLCGLTDGRRIVVESSANLRSCRNIEQFCMTESAELFEFHREWMNEVIAATKRN